VAGAAGEQPEDNSPPDYAPAHITLLDSTASGGQTPSDPTHVRQARQPAILNYLAADLAAPPAQRKIVATHHPPKSAYDHSDTGEGMAAEIIPVLVNAGADLLLVGHSHNYQRSYPLTGYAAGNVTFIGDPSGVYVKGAQVIQVLGGTGGRDIDSNINSPNSARDWLAAAFVSDNGGTVGPVLVEVSQSELRVKYLAAGNGQIKDEFTVVVPGPLIALSASSIARSVFIGGTLPDEVFTVSNGGPDTLTYAISDDADWLSVSPAGGTSAGEADPITLGYDLAGLKAGQHVGHIRVTSPDAVNSPRELTVTLNIETVRPDFDGDGDVDQSDFGHLQECLTSPAMPQPSPACLNANLNIEAAVDVYDMAILLGCMSGDGIPAAAGCEGGP
jgi:hypothetical protein